MASTETIDLEFELLRWSAWAPGIDNPEAWRAWLDGQPRTGDETAPDVSFMPAMQRRRLSRMARMGFCAIEDCLDEGEPALPIVFASRHGELNRSHSLLECLARNETLSPKDFSLSVHNATTGLYSIFRDNHQPSTAIAAGIDTLPAGLLECLMQSLASQGECLLVWVEESVPAFYRDYLPAAAPNACLAMRVAPIGSGGRPLVFQSSPAAAEDTPATEEAVLRHLLSVLLERRPRSEWTGARCRWVLEATDVAA
jgi:hypothetical protein